MKQKILSSLANLLAFTAKVKEAQVEEKPSYTSSLISIPSEETIKIVDQMAELNRMWSDRRFEIIETHIGQLHTQISVLIENEKQTQNLIVGLMTTVEEILHTLEEAGLTEENLIHEALTDNETDLTITKQQCKQDDVASDSYKAKKYIDDGIHQQQHQNKLSKRKFDLN